VPVPEIGRGEILVRVHTCGICGTDLKKIASGSHSSPRIFGHETSGVVARIGQDVRKFKAGDRVVVFHHIPAANVITAAARLSRSVNYKKVGCTAGFEPSGGGFAEYVRVMDWIVEKGAVAIPNGISFEQACFVEPVNTCMKGIQTLRLESDENSVGYRTRPDWANPVGTGRADRGPGDNFRFVSGRGLQYLENSGLSTQLMRRRRIRFVRSAS